MQRLHFRKLAYWQAIILSLLAFAWVSPVEAKTATPTPIPVAILSPLPGQAIQGQVPIIVNTTVEGFQSAELDFGYLNDPTQTWFLIALSSEPLGGDKITEWDTTTITDGDYSLRLVVTQQDGNQVVATIEGVRVRNYSMIETDTPVPSPTPAPGQTPLPTITPSPSATPLPPTPTPLATNPAQITPRDIKTSLLWGAAGSLVIFALLGIYAAIRAVARR